MHISIDIGGTNTRVASSKNLNEIYKIKRYPTLKNINIDREKLTESIYEVSDKEPLESICVGVPGVIDKKNLQILFVPNYKELNGSYVRDLLDPTFNDVSLFSTNDALLAGLAEACMDKENEEKKIAYITLSTGVGGALIQNNAVSPFHEVTEPGHSIIDISSVTSDSANIYGTVEALLSGTAFERIYGIKAENCDDKKIWNEYGKNLSKFLINIMSFWDPDTIVLGGSVSNKFDLFYPALVEYYSAQKFFRFPKVTKSKLMDDAGVMGGFLYIKQMLKTA